MDDRITLADLVTKYKAAERTGPTEEDLNRARIEEFAIAMVEREREDYRQKHSAFYRNTTVFTALCKALDRLLNMDKLFAGQVETFNELEDEIRKRDKEIARLVYGLRRIKNSMRRKEDGKRAKKIAMDTLGDKYD